MKKYAGEGKLMPFHTYQNESKMSLDDFKCTTTNHNYTAATF